MSPLPDETQIRHLLQQVKRADQDLVPSFDDLLRRDMSVRQLQSMSRLRLAAVGLAVIISIVVVWRSIPNGSDQAEPSHEVAKDYVPRLPTDAAHRDRIADLDFDYLQRLIDEHFALLEEASIDSIPVWSSGTESLLAMTLEVGMGETPLPRWLLQPGEGSGNDHLPDGEGT